MVLSFRIKEFRVGVGQAFPKLVLRMDSHPKASNVWFLGSEVIRTPRPPQHALDFIGLLLMVYVRHHGIFLNQGVSGSIGFLGGLIHKATAKFMEPSCFVLGG